jgi:peptidoglycan/LPS O-acetylase OafA/YrhL
MADSCRSAGAGTSDFLNASRWVAAFLVLIGHVRHLVLVDLADVRPASLATKALYLVTGLGHEAVVVFFVVSGYLVGGVTLQRWLAAGVDLRAYALSRISRIHTVLLPALLLGAGLDLAGLSFFNESGLYTHPELYRTILLVDPVEQQLTAWAFIGCLLSLQGIVAPVLGSNGPLWSLAYEWWYYILFALLAAGLLPRTTHRFACLALALVLFMALPFKVTLWGSLWLIGLLANRWVTSGRALPAAIFCVPAFLVAILLSRLSHNQTNAILAEPMWIEYARDLGLALCYATCLAGAARWRRGLVGARIHRALADFSYSTYLIHFPVMLFLVAVCFQFNGTGIRMQPSAGAIAFLCAIAALAWLLCFLVSMLTERHTAAFRRALDSAWGSRRMRATS